MRTRIRHTRLFSFVAGDRDGGCYRVAVLAGDMAEAWNPGEWPARMNLSNITVETIFSPHFDKCEEILGLMLRRHRKPDIILVEANASHFPGDLSICKDLVRRWTRQLQRERDLHLILTTIAPPQHNPNAETAAGPDPSADIAEFNRWIREHAHLEHLALLDLEKTGDLDRELFQVLAGVLPGLSPENPLRPRR